MARKVFLNSSETVVKKVVGYALLSKRDLSAVGDVASEVRVMLGTDKLGGVTVEHVHRAITEFLIPSDAAFKSALVTAEAGQRKSRRQAPQLPPEPLEDSEPIAAAADLAPAPAPAALATPAAWPAGSPWTPIRTPIRTRWRSVGVVSARFNWPLKAD